MQNHLKKLSHGAHFAQVGHRLNGGWIIRAHPLFGHWPERAKKRAPGSSGYRGRGIIVSGQSYSPEFGSAVCIPQSAWREKVPPEPKSRFMTMRVLFTQGLSNVYDAITLIRSAMRPGEFFITASHRTGYTPLKTVVDTFVTEPETAIGMAYIQWLLEVCRRHRIDLLWPQSHLPTLFEHRRWLTAEGIRVLLPCADRDTLAIIDNKIHTAETLRQHAVALPRWQPFRTAEELDDALSALGYPAKRLCIKPAVSICAQGFRILDDRRDRFARFIQNDSSTIGVDELKALLAEWPGATTFLAMEYLAGDERSIDCLVMEGTLVQSVTRRKPRAAGSRLEIIENDPEGRAVAASVCRVFGLNGLVNIQTRERIRADGSREQCFMEINARMSGGINMACLSGVVLPYWTLRLAAGTAQPEDVPKPRADLLVTTVYQAVALGNLPAPGPASSRPDFEDAGQRSDFRASGTGSSRAQAKGG